MIGLFVASSAGGPMESRDELEVGTLGVLGDRYAAGRGTWPGRPAREAGPEGGPGSGRAVTLIEEEAISAVRGDYGIDLPPGATRRNVVTRGVALNHLVGRPFRVGVVELLGVRLAEPCRHLEALTAAGVRRAFVHRGGLRADVLSGGSVRVGDRLRVDDDPSGRRDIS